jgi:cystine transport system substrate-binding protein
VSVLLVLPVAVNAEPVQSVEGLRAENAALETRARSAVLGLYALDSRLEAARRELTDLEAKAERLRIEQITLARELEVARKGARVSQRRLAARIRLLYDHGSTSTLEVILGARSLEQALFDLDALNRVASINQQVLDQLRTAKTRISRSSRALALRKTRLAAALSAQKATLRAVENTRAERAAYLADLKARQDLNAQQIAALQARSHAAEARTRELVGGATGVRQASGLFAATAQPVLSSGRTLTVTAVAYSLPGFTASGLPVGWGVVAVDPSVIPLGTHMTVPGYGEAVAADTGTAIIGTIIDLWFPTTAQAAAWGRRTVTITLE